MAAQRRRGASLREALLTPYWTDLTVSGPVTLELARDHVLDLWVERSVRAEDQLAQHRH